MEIKRKCRKRFIVYLHFWLIDWTIHWLIIYCCMSRLYIFDISLSCHTCCNTGPKFLWSYLKDHGLQGKKRPLIQWCGRANLSLNHENVLDLSRNLFISLNLKNIKNAKNSKVHLHIIPAIYLWPIKNLWIIKL